MNSSQRRAILFRKICETEVAGEGKLKFRSGRRPFGSTSLGYFLLADPRKIEIDFLTSVIIGKFIFIKIKIILP
jgi:hypothetical protein